MFFDAHAIIVQQDGDGGDSLHREGMYAFGKRLLYDSQSNMVSIYNIEKDAPVNRAPASDTISKFEIRPGVYVRNPDPFKWYSNPDTTSRDQLVPVIAYCAAYKDYPRLWRLFKATASRGMFAQNILRAGDGNTEAKVPDTMIGHLGLFIRAGGYWTAPFYPLLFITDTMDLVGTILEALPLHWEESNFRLRFRGENDVHDNNTIIAHLVAARYKPTSISWLNRMVYSWTRAPNLGNTILGESNPVMGALVWYHRREAGGNPELAEVYRPLVESYFSPEKTALQWQQTLVQRIWRDEKRSIASTP